ncbi:amidohydrolase family protein [Nocardia sp. 004]|uniref:amidohydrolase family protein n=1 Tax=Nocardia sp. 004 TaxID=3385978 RepID=UPI0039A0DCF5
MSLIDTHHHCYFPQLTSRLRTLGVTEMAPGVPLPRWSPQDSLAMLDAIGIEHAVTSVILPAAAAAVPGLDRAVNEWTAELIRDHPRRFGGLCSLPWHDPDAAVREIAYGLDELGLDGVVLPTVAAGRSIADPAFEPVFATLHDRRVTAFLHPTPGSTCGCMSSAVPPVVVDFVMDTTRTVADLIFRGTLGRYPGMTLIVAHAGGAIPYLRARLELASAWNFPGGHSVTAAEIREQIGSLYYEVAQSISAPTLACLKEVTTDDHILFGTDFPFINAERLAQNQIRPSNPDAAQQLFTRWGEHRAVSP